MKNYAINGGIGMTPRERFIKALRREPIEGHVPHFELVMFLTMEAWPDTSVPPQL